MISFDDAYELLHGLSKPSKMPWYSWSIPATECHTGSKLHKIEGSVCFECYALSGFYRMTNVKRAMDARFKALNSPHFVEAFVVVLTRFYETGQKTYIRNGKKVKEDRFRWHDSGDVQSVKHLDQLNQIALATPFLRHWIPTKEAGFVGTWLKAHPAGFAPNLIVRLSHPMIGDTFANKSPSGMPFSTVGYKGKGVRQCPAAAKQGNKCLDCDACWKRENVAVNYPLH